MITDRIQLAGLDAYFRDPATNRINLGGLTPTIRTAPNSKGKQVEFSGIQLLIEGDDLRPMLAFQTNGQNPLQPRPLMRIKVMKEMFPGLFADPFSHRVHNIAGFLDFNEGTLTNGRIMEVDGIPTICSTGKEECSWISREYVMPEPISINAIAWELASAKLTPPDSFHYKIEVSLNGGTTMITIDNGGQMLKADAKRAIDGLNNSGINRFQITFTAKVFQDSYLQERSLPLLFENLGRPLLRAINILEPVQSIYEVNSLLELQNLCSDFHLFETPGPEIKRLTAMLDLSAVLVHSVNEDVASGKYEYVELELMSDDFVRFEALKIAEIVLRNV